MKKAIVLLDNQNIECLVVPDDYETGYMSMNEIAKKAKAFLLQNEQL